MSAIVPPLDGILEILAVLFATGSVCDKVEGLWTDSCDDAVIYDTTSYRMEEARESGLVAGQLGEGGGSKPF